MQRIEGRNPRWDSPISDPMGTAILVGCVLMFSALIGWLASVSMTA
jgi:hypothetical protein